MQRPTTVSLPPFSPDRLATRIAEALAVAQNPKAILEFPPWARHVMRKLAKEFVPAEFARVLTMDGSILSEGIAISFAAQAQDMVSSSDLGGIRLARLLGEKISADPEAQQIAELVTSGAIGELEPMKKHVLERIFSGTAMERRSFAEGLALGNRLPEMFENRIKGRSSAAEIYLILWLYWPEIHAMKSVGEVGRALKPLFAENQNLAGAWDERFRKLANRLKLSFRAKQRRRKRA